MTAPSFGLICTNRLVCRERVMVRTDLVTVGLGSDLHGDPGHIVTWTCPACLALCTDHVPGRIGSWMIDHGAKPAMPDIDPDDALVSPSRGVVRLFAGTLGSDGHRRTIIQHVTADGPAPFRHLFADQAEARRYLASTEHPAGGAA